MKESEINKTNQTRNIIIAAGAGAAVGAIAALLLAPKSGKELRKDITDNVSDAATSVKEQITSTIDSASETIQKIPTTSKSTLATAAKTVRQIAETMEHSLNGNS